MSPPEPAWPGGSPSAGGRGFSASMDGRRSAAGRGEAAAVSAIAIIAAFAWFVTAALWGYVAFLQYTAHVRLVETGVVSGLLPYAIGNAIGSGLAFFIGLRLLQNASRRFLGASFAWGLLNVGYGIAQIDQRRQVAAFLIACVVAVGIASLLALAARPDARAFDDPL